MLPMKDLKLLFEQNGCIDVQTYIQSGNVVFRSAISDTGRLAKQVTASGLEGARIRAARARADAQRARAGSGEQPVPRG